MPRRADGTGARGVPAMIADLPGGRRAWGDRTTCYVPRARCFVRAGRDKIHQFGAGLRALQDIMSSIQATRMKKGMLIKIDQDLFRVLELQHVTPGNLRGFVRVKFRNIRTGTLSD
ncbi:MAG: hypothetical protein ACRD15_10960, partial [Vicinamibacterales bacterium]